MTTLASTGTLTIGDAELEYRFVGPQPDAAPTLVLLHEGLGSAALWGDFPEQLAAATGAGVFAYSRAGYGRSTPVPLPRPLDYMQREAFEVLPRVLDAIGFRRGLLIGHSDGASIATLYAGGVADHRIRGVSLIAPHFIVEDISVRSIAEIKQTYETTELRAKLSRWHADVDNAFYGWNDAWLDPKFRAWDISDASRLYPRAAADRAGRGRSLRHGAADRDRARAMLLPARGQPDRRRGVIRRSARRRRRRWRPSPTSPTAF